MNVSHVEERAQVQRPPAGVLIGLSATWLLFFVPLLFQSATVTAASVNVQPNGFALNACATIIAFTIIGLLRRSISVRPVVLCAGGVIFALGNLATHFYTVGALPGWAGLVASGFEGAGLVSIFCLWMHILQNEDLARFGRTLIGTMLVGASLLALAMLASFLGVYEVWIVVVLVAGVASVPWGWIAGQGSHERRAVRVTLADASSPFLIPLSMECLLFFVGFVFMSSYSIISNGLDIVVGLAMLFIALAIAAIILAMVLRFAAVALSASRLLKVSILGVSFGLICYLAWPSVAGYAAKMLVLVGYCCFLPSELLLMREVARMFNADFLYVFTNGMGLVFCGQAMGSALALTPLFSGFGGGASSLQVLPFLAIPLVVALIVVGFFLLDGERVDTLWGLRVEDEQPVVAWDAQESAHRLAAACGLTARQEEVLVLLADGKNARDIEQELVISNATARAHIRAIYEKLDVHSINELMKKLHE